MSRLRTGFTLIELRVVISIIAILASLLMPGIAMVRDQAKRMVCASDLRQIGAGIMAYGNDNDGYLVSTAHIITGTTRRWTDLIPEYTETKTNGTNIASTRTKSVLDGCPEWKFSQTASWLVGIGINYHPDRPRNLYATNRMDYRPGFFTANMTDFLLSQISNLSTRQLLADSIDYHTDGVVDLERHRGRCNTLFFDLHVQALGTLNEVNTSYNTPNLGLP